MFTIKQFVFYLERIFYLIVSQFMCRVNVALLSHTMTHSYCGVINNGVNHRTSWLMTSQKPFNEVIVPGENRFWAPLLLAILPISLLRDQFFETELFSSPTADGYMGVILC